MSSQNANASTQAAEIAKLQAEIAALKAAASQPRKLSLKVSAKGALSVYGMGRFPVTLYASQWETLLNMGADITAFIKANPTLVRKAA